MVLSTTWIINIHLNNHFKQTRLVYFYISQFEEQISTLKQTILNVLMTLEDTLQKMNDQPPHVSVEFLSVF